MKKNNKFLPKAQNWNSFWDKNYKDQIDKISWSKKRIISIVKPFIKKNNNALDAGCGSGFFSKFFCDEQMKAVSCDYSSEALEITKRMTNGRSEVLKKDLLDKNLSKELKDRFHIIFSDGLFEHFSWEQRDEIMSNLKNILDDDGVIITFVPNRWSPWQLIRPFLMPGIKEDPFTLKELVDLNLKNGLQVFQKGGINTFPFSFSPDRFLGQRFGMLLYTISKKI